VKTFGELVDKLLGDKKICILPSPETVNKNVIALRHFSPTKFEQEVSKMQTQIESLRKQMVEMYSSKIMDPRIHNNPLPNESTITYRYGARCYITECYPDYVWRNGFWYRKSETLRFEKMNKNNIKAAMFGTTLHDKYHIGTDNYVLDDSFYPIMYNETRIFVRESWETQRDAQFIYRGAVMYYPYTQNFAICEYNITPYMEYNKRREKEKKKEGDANEQESHIVYEDLDNMGDYIFA
jgi:hypothetical protein